MNVPMCRDAVRPLGPAQPHSSEERLPLPIVETLASQGFTLCNVPGPGRCLLMFVSAKHRKHLRAELNFGPGFNASQKEIVVHRVSELFVNLPDFLS